jgi:hypothetical protein
VQSSFGHKADASYLPCVAVTLVDRPLTQGQKVRTAGGQTPRRIGCGPGQVWLPA